jgi:threonine dehydrogenase-like Zn-dependent dehydrogenase
MISASALVYENPGNPVFKNIKAEKPKKGCVGIDIIASSLCNTSELRSFKGGYESGYGVSYPMKTGEPGHEAAGRISIIGPGVSDFEIGDIVAMTGHGGEPCHRSYVNRNCNDIAKINPDGRDVVEAAVLEMYGCAYHCAMAPISANDYEKKKILVLGMGSMGICTVQILNNIDTGILVAADLSDERLEIAVKSGADKAVKPRMIDPLDKFDIIIECSGSIRGQELACSLAPGVLIFSSYNTKGITIRQNLWFDAHTTIYNPGIVTSENFKKAVGLYNRKLLDTSVLVQKRIKPNRHEYMRTIKEIKSGKIIKAIMEW